MLSLSLVLASDSESLSFFSSSSLPRKNLRPATRIYTGSKAGEDALLLHLFNRLCCMAFKTGKKTHTFVTLEKHAVVMTLTVLASFL